MYQTESDRPREVNYAEQLKSGHDRMMLAIAEPAYLPLLPDEMGKAYSKRAYTPLERATWFVDGHLSHAELGSRTFISDRLTNPFEFPLDGYVPYRDISKQGGIQDAKWAEALYIRYLNQCGHPTNKKIKVSVSAQPAMDLAAYGFDIVKSIVGNTVLLAHAVPDDPTDRKVRTCLNLYREFLRTETASIPPVHIMGQVINHIDRWQDISSYDALAAFVAIVGAVNSVHYLQLHETIANKTKDVTDEKDQRKKYRHMLYDGSLIVGMYMSKGPVLQSVVSYLQAQKAVASFFHSKRKTRNSSEI